MNEETIVKTFSVFPPGSAPIRLEVIGERPDFAGIYREIGRQFVLSNCDCVIMADGKFKTIYTLSPGSFSSVLEVREVLPIRQTFWQKLCGLFSND